MVFHDKKRCHCHKPRHQRPSLILACDVILGIMIALFVFFLLFYVVLPRFGIKSILGEIKSTMSSGLVFMVILIASNFGWAIYYGCQKSKAGVVLALMTTMTVLYSYFMR